MASSPLPCSLRATVVERALARARRRSRRASARGACARRGRRGRRGVRSRSSVRLAPIAVLLHLAVVCVRGSEVGDGGCHQQDVAGAECFLARRLQLGGGSTRRRSGRRAVRGQVDVRGDHRRPRRRARGGLVRDREAHAARRAVADVAHRVDRLARPARGDEDAQARPRRGRRPRAQQASTAASRSARLGQPAGARARRSEPSRPTPGSMTSTPRSRSSATFARVAACAHIRSFIAGATSTGQVAASADVVSRLSASPAASLAMVLADAGATRSASALRDELEVAQRVVRRAAPGRGTRRGRGRAPARRSSTGRAGERREGRRADEVAGSPASGRRGPRGPRPSRGGRARAPCTRRSRR